MWPKGTRAAFKKSAFGRGYIRTRRLIVCTAVDPEVDKKHKGRLLSAQCMEMKEISV